MSTFNKYRTKGAYHYDWYETEDWYKWLVDKCVKFCNGDTIDVGCGDGLLCMKLADKGLNVTGIDSDNDALALASDRVLNAEFRLMQAKPFGDRAWQYLTCLNVIEHLDDPDVIRQMIKRNVTAGAIITTIDYQGGSLGEDHKFEWTYDQMMDFFKEFNPKGFRYKDTEWIGVEIRK